MGMLTEVFPIQFVPLLISAVPPLPVVGEMSLKAVPLSVCCAESKEKRGLPKGVNIAK
jgi:hypothetical protein